MFLDALNEFDPKGSALTVTRASTNILDMGAANGLPAVQGRDIAAGCEALDIFCAVTQTFTAAGAATLQVQIQGAIDNGSGAPGTWVTLMQTDLIPVANLTIGMEVCRSGLPMWQPAQAGNNGPPRFYRLNYVVATGPMTAGSLQAELIPHDSRNQGNLYYAAGFQPNN